MIWTELSIHTVNEAVEPISNILHENGAQGVVHEDPAELIKERDNIFGEIYDLNPDDFPTEGVIIKAYFAKDELNQEALEKILARVSGLKEYDIDLGKNTHQLVDIDEEEWAHGWKKYFHPIRITEQLTIVPTWEGYTAESSDEKLIYLDPGMAFGTGSHPTTSMCLQALEKHVKPGDLVYDVGTGSGILSIASVLLGAGHVKAMDLDYVAVTVAEENCELNKVSDKVEILRNNLLEGVEGQADIIVANILAEVICLFTDDVAKLLKDDGVFITSGISSGKRDMVYNALEASGLEVVEDNESDVWVALTCKKRG